MESKVKKVNISQGLTLEVKRLNSCLRDHGNPRLKSKTDVCFCFEGNLKTEL